MKDVIEYFLTAVIIAVFTVGLVYCSTNHQVLDADKAIRFDYVRTISK